MWQLLAGLAAIGGWLALTKPGSPSAAELLAAMTKDNGAPAVRNVVSSMGRLYRLHEWHVGQVVILLIVGGAAATRPAEPDVTVVFRDDPTGPRVSDVSRLDPIAKHDVKEILSGYMPSEGT